MDSFNLPLSRGVDTDGHAFFKAWDGRPSLHLTPDEFFTLFDLLYRNGEKLSREIKTLESMQQES